MRRIAGTLLVAATLGMATGSAAAQSEPESEDADGPGPVVLGGRIEVPHEGIAIEFPTGWYAFDLSHPALIEEMEAFDETTALIAPNIEAMTLAGAAPALAAEFPQLEQLLIAIEPLTDPDFAETCNLLAEPRPFSSVDLVVAGQLPRMRAELDIEGEIKTSFIELPVGRTAVLEFTQPRSIADETTEFIFLHDDRAYTLTCGDVERRSSRWLSIAESVEFLPLDGAATAEDGADQSVAAKAVEASPIGFGGRVEVEEGGYAITLPDDWTSILTDRSAQRLLAS